MYEYHRWCSLRWSAGEVDDDAQELRGLELVGSFVAQLHWPNGFRTLTFFNGKYCMHLGGFTCASDRTLLMQLSIAGDAQMYFIRR